MAKTKTKTATVDNSIFQKLKASFKRYWFLWIIGIGLVGFFLVYQPISIYLDKQRFLKAEQEIEKVATQIQDKIGPADQTNRSNYCTYGSRKFGQGPRGCSAVINILYENRDSDKSSELMRDAASLFADDLYSFLDEMNTDSFIPSDQRDRQEYTQSLQDFSGLSCKVSYHFPANSALEPMTSSHDENLRITISCHGRARAEYYPVIE